MDLRLLLVISILSSTAHCNNEDPKGPYSILQSLLTPLLSSSHQNAGTRLTEPPIVTIKNGSLEGTTYTALGGDTIYAYLSIPYAKAPVNELRFQPPQPIEEGWNGTTRIAYLHPPACPQTLTNTTPAEEDCLFLSVYTKKPPNDTSTQKRPVLYWIHGGGFILGQTSYYTGSKLLQSDVVLVTVQYRLGPFGFFSTGDSIVPGNMGMKDMVAGLRWVQENIESFGGDPGRVTVIGESAGAASAIFMLVSPLTRGHNLFHSVAALSGSPLAEWARDTNPVESAQRLAQAANCTSANSSIDVNCLMLKPWEDLSRAHLFMLLNSVGGSLKATIAGASVVVEPESEGAFLTKETLQLLENGDFPNIPVLLGATQHEGSLLLAFAYVLKLWNHTEDEVYVHDKLMGDLLATFGVDEGTNGASISQALAAGFVDVDDLRTNFTTFQYQLVDLASILFFKAPILRTAELLSRKNPNVYLYSFEYASRSSLWNVVDILKALIPHLPDLPFLPENWKEVLMKMIPEFDGGITHADDLLYMFSLPIIPLPPTLKDIEMMRTYPGFFTDFAINGRPSPNWPPFSINEPNYMEIKSTPTLKQHYMRGWRQGITFPEGNE